MDRSRPKDLIDWKLHLLPEYGTLRVTVHSAKVVSLPDVDDYKIFD